jgi:hypothetical protein
MIRIIRWFGAFAGFYAFVRARRLQGFYRQVTFIAGAFNDIYYFPEYENQ